MTKLSHLGFNMIKNGHESFEILYLRIGKVLSKVKVLSYRRKIFKDRWNMRILN